MAQKLIRAHFRRLVRAINRLNPANEQPADILQHYRKLFEAAGLLSRIARRDDIAEFDFEYQPVAIDSGAYKQ